LGFEIETITKQGIEKWNYDVLLKSRRMLSKLHWYIYRRCGDGLFVRFHKRAGLLTFTN